MPIYDFQCSSCGHKSEVLRKISEPSTAECPNCHQPTFSKQLSAPSFQLNGTGWYATDFKGGNNKNASNAEVSNSKDSDLKEDKSKETKPKETLPESAKPAAACNPGCACH